MDVYLIRPKEVFISSEVVEGISDHKEVLLDLDGNISRKGITIGTKVRQYKKANIGGLQGFLREQYDRFLRTDGGMEEIWGVFKDIIFEALQKFVPCKILKNNPDPEYYTAKIRRMKRITRKAFKNRKRSSEHMNIFRNRSKELEREKKIAQEAYLKNILDGREILDRFLLSRIRTYTRSDIRSIGKVM